MAAPLKHVFTKLQNTEFNAVLCRLHQRSFSFTSAKARSLLLGVYKDAKSKEAAVMTPACKHFDELSNGKISKSLQGKRIEKVGNFMTFYDIVPDYSNVMVCCLGPRHTDYDPLDRLNVGRNNIRLAIAGALSHREETGDSEFDIDPCGDAEVAAESAFLLAYKFGKFYKSSSESRPLHPSLLTTSIIDSPNIKEQWQRGMVKAEAQNWARLLMDTPANLMTPTIFANTVLNKFENSKVTVTVRDKAWIESENMNAFLAVAQGSTESPKFLHLEYKHPDSTHERPIALVGKGVTFDTGGISLKPSANMDAMKGDMGGAACVVAAFSAIEKLGIPVNIQGFVPLTENMPGGRAIKPGDVVYARNGKSIQIDNTDAEGRLILADALNYAETINPSMIVDLATLTGAIDVALGSAAAGTYSTSDTLYNILEKAGSETGDRVWRMPLFQDYVKQVSGSITDVNNVGKVKGSGGSCTAAAFLKNFVTYKNWMHLDIAGVMAFKSGDKFASSGMSGRPTRTLVDFISRVATMPASELYKD